MSESHEQDAKLLELLQTSSTSSREQKKKEVSLERDSSTPEARLYHNSKGVKMTRMKCA